MNSTVAFCHSSVEAALIELAARCHRLRPAKAARTLGVSRQRVQRAIDGLVAQGLASTAPDPHDGRVHVVALTALGQLLAVQLRAAGGSSCSQPAARSAPALG